MERPRGILSSYFETMQSFQPQQIIIEAKVEGSSLTNRIINKFKKVPKQTIHSYQELKIPQDISQAKRTLILAEQRGEYLKPFPKIKHAINLGDFVFNPVSNCHLECTYCILQSYLKNNPSITIFANWENYAEAILKKAIENPEHCFRMGTGELSDSLALDNITNLSQEMVPLFAKIPNAFLELKTKSNAIDNLLQLEHRGHTVISWSMAPEEIIKKEELKCASLNQRIECAVQVQQAGYPVGIHLDPLIYFEDWQKAYQTLIEKIAQKLDPKRIAWVSVGSLRFDKDLKREATSRFPQTKIFSEEFIAAPDGKFRYFKEIRQELYQKLWRWLADWSDDFPRYLCMEAPWMWEAVTSQKAPSPEDKEKELTDRLKSLC
ncbi:MAG: DNA photolyase [Deltaproteobacteria bacterium]|nr:DNA photolyase [Deltaproteobacteria bacterium]